ncbi:MAG: succinyl-diaminopimelate desuccinylase [Flavobacteriaceae bacterium]
MNPRDPVAILQALIRCPSVTPEDAGALPLLKGLLEATGFDAEIVRFSDRGTPDIDNLYARIGTGAPYILFAGHTDVVPTGDESAWRHPPFGAEIDGGRLYGRGAVDMKGGIAAFAAAAARHLDAHGGRPAGSIGLLITGDEEGPAVNGTRKLLEWAAAKGERFDHCIVGEPTSAAALGDQIKIGRRGSFSCTLTVEGVQGHAAYPHLADNPVRGLATVMEALFATPLDAGSEHFEPSTLEAVGLESGTGAWNVIPGRASIRLNSRYNDRWTRETLKAEIARRAESVREDSRLRPHAKAPIAFSIAEAPGPSDVFLTRDEALIDAAAGAVEAVTGRRPALSTGGGTSDARFIKDHCPVVELGLVGDTMHMVDESVPVADLETLTEIYRRFLETYFDTFAG